MSTFTDAQHLEVNCASIFVDVQYYARNGASMFADVQYSAADCMSMFVDGQYSLGNDAPMFEGEQHSAGNGASTFIDAHYSTADGAPTFTDTQHSQVNGAPTFIDAPFRFEVQYLVKKAANIDSTRQKYKVLPILVAICGGCRYNGTKKWRKNLQGARKGPIFAVRKNIALRLRTMFMERR